jgi:hypothetical protein
MIKYRLICNNCEIIFDSWFSSSSEYERLKKKKFIKCYVCNSIKVEKTLMAPSVLKQKDPSKTQKQIKKYKKTRQSILKYQEFIKKNFEYVGKNFAYEVRSIHYKDKEISKGIYGSATKEDLKELKDEGIEVESLPWVIDNTN